MEGRVPLRHYGGLIPDEVGLSDVMFLKVRDAHLRNGDVGQ